MLTISFVAVITGNNLSVHLDNSLLKTNGAVSGSYRECSFHYASRGLGVSSYIFAQKFLLYFNTSVSLALQWTKVKDTIV